MKAIVSKDYESDNKIESDNEVSRSNIIMKELSKNNSLTSPKTIDLSNLDKVNAMVKKILWIWFK